jgi:hypothetical protein
MPNFRVLKYAFLDYWGSSHHVKVLLPLNLNLITVLTGS